MRNSTIIVLIFLLGSISPCSLMAQSNLSFGADGVQHEDTLYIGDSIHFNFWLVNQGGGTINDSVLVSCETFDIVGTSISSMPIGDGYNTLGSLSPGDSVFISITEVVSYSSYVLGDNIIVIWPAFIGSGSADTSITPIHILGGVSTIDELAPPSHDLLVFPNPAKDCFTISNHSNLPISGISITDNLGKILYADKNIYPSPLYFNLSNFKPGTYFVETIVKNQRIVKRVILTR